VWFGVGACQYTQFILKGMSLFSNWDSSEGTVTGRGGGLLRTLASIPCKDNSLISLPKVLNNEGFCLGVKRLGHVACHLPSSGAEAKNKCSYTYISHHLPFGCARGQVYTMSVHKHTMSVHKLTN
jgi:hypothetical protein